MKAAASALAAVVLASCMTASGVHAADIKSVLARPLERMQMADYRASGRLVLVGSSGTRTSYPLTLKAHWFPGVLRIFAEINAPGRARARILLEMRPNGQDSIRVAHPGDKAATVLPFELWNESPAGAVDSGFSYEDLLEPQYFWTGQAAPEQTRYGVRDCDLIKSTPGPSDRTHYAEIRTWLDRSIGYPVYVEKSIKGTGSVREFTYFGLRQNEGVWSASQVESKIRGKAGSTLLIIDRGSPRAKLTLVDFNPEQLTRF